MRFEPAKWQHASLSLLILVFFIILLYLIIISPALHARSEFDERFSELQFQAVKLSRSINHIENIRDDLKSLKESGADWSGFLGNKSESLAAADLQELLNQLISDNAGNVLSTQVVSNDEEDLYPKVTVKVHMNGDIESLQKILYQIQSGKPVLIVDNLFIQSRPLNRLLQRSASARAPLDVRFDVTGFIYTSTHSS
jgi:general secretion pathway protein M